MHSYLPIRYINPVFRPPSEAESLILPITNGCSWNKCTYCEMYTAPQKKFAVRDEQETLDSIRNCGAQYANQVQRVFLGDGDAMVLSTRRLMTLLAAIKEHLPKVRRISTYCLPSNEAVKKTNFHTRPFGGARFADRISRIWRSCAKCAAISLPFTPDSGSRPLLPLY